MDTNQQPSQVVVGGEPQPPPSRFSYVVRRFLSRAFSSLPYKLTLVALVIILLGAGGLGSKAIWSQFSEKHHADQAQQAAQTGSPQSGIAGQTNTGDNPTAPAGGDSAPVAGAPNKGSTSSGKATNTNAGSTGPAGGDSSTSTPTGGGSTSCALPKYPTPSCTGVPANTILATINGNVTLSTAGQVLDAKIVTGDVIVSANNVVIKNSEIRGTVRNDSGKSFTLQDSLVGPVSGCDSYVAVGFENYTARRVQIHNFGDGFRVSGNNVTIEDSFVKLCSNPTDHSDGIQGYYGGANVTISHNTIDQRPAQDVTSPIFFADNSKSATITNNLLMGGGYSLRIHDDATPDIGPWVITGNRIVQGSWDYGAASTTNTACATTTWADNRLVTIDSSYGIVSTGATVGC